MGMHVDLAIATVSHRRQDRYLIAILDVKVLSFGKIIPFNAMKVSSICLPTL
jgi:hypothetical protein